ncbi:MAG: aminotransferase class IV [Spirochaetia bacterium]|nr:aminotransferase class IV [Spirochaetia bacterium]
MKNVGYYNGKMGLQEEMSVPFLDRAMFFGDGVYDATYCANRRLFEIDYHTERFYNSLRLTRIPFKFSKEELVAELQKCIDAMDSDGVCFVYWECTRGTAPRNHLFPDVEPNLLITITESKLTDLRTPCKLITEEDTRFFHCNIKTLNLLPSVMGSQRAFEAGAKEVIFHRGERVTECAHTNVNILKGGKFITPPLDELILPGVTRRHYLEICKRLGIPYEERPFTLDELFAADEVFITSAGTLGLPAYEIDGKPVGGKDKALLKRLQTEAVADFYKETGYQADIV